MIGKQQILPTVDGGGEEPGICVFGKHITKIVNHSVGGAGSVGGDTDRWDS